MTEVFPDSSVGKESACNAGDPSSIPGSGRSPGEGKGYPLEYILAWRIPWTCIIHGVAKSQTQLSDFHFHFHDIGPYSQGYVLPVVMYGYES